MSDAPLQIVIRFDGDEKKLRSAVARVQRELAKVDKSVPASGGGITRFFNAAGSSALEFAGTLGVATTAAGVAFAAFNKLQQSSALAETLRLNGQMLGVYTGSQSKANRIIDEAAAFGARYNMTLSEQSEAVKALGPLLRVSNASTEKQLSVLARLAQTNPTEGISGAAFAIRELASGDITSIVERFNLSRKAMNQLKDQVQGGADAFVVLDRYMNQNGLTNALLEQRTQGLTAAHAELNTALEQIGQRIGDTVNPFWASVERGASLVIRNVNLATLSVTELADMFQQGMPATSAYNSALERLEAQSPALQQATAAQRTELERLRDEQRQQIANLIDLQKNGYGYSNAADYTRGEVNRLTAAIKDHSQAMLNNIAISEAATASAVRQIEAIRALPLAMAQKNAQVRGKGALDAFASQLNDTVARQQYEFDTSSPQAQLKVLQAQQAKLRQGSARYYEVQRDIDNVKEQITRESEAAVKAADREEKLREKQLKAEEKISDERMKQYQSLLDARLLQIQDARQRILESEELKRVQRVAASGGSVGNTMAQLASLRAQEIPLQQLQRQAEIASRFHDAGVPVAMDTPQLGADAATITLPPVQVDVYLDGQKVGGILEQRVMAGLGHALDETQRGGVTGR